jgi:hypothetical protein
LAVGSSALVCVPMVLLGFAPLSLPEGLQPLNARATAVAVTRATFVRLTNVLPSSLIRTPSTPGPGVERIPNGVAQQAEGEHQDRDADHGQP